MFETLYITDNEKQAIDFINNLTSDLQKIGFENIKHDRENDSISVKQVFIKSISIYGSCLGISQFPVKYFIDGINMKRYKDMSNERLDNVLSHIKSVMTQFREDTKQLSGKDELIEVLMEEI